MQPPPPSRRRAASALLDEQGWTEATPAGTVGLEQVTAVLHQRLGPWIGADGCARLLAHSISLASVQHESLRGVTVAPVPPHLDSPQSPAPVPIAATREAAETVLLSVLEDLGRLIGEPVALRILLPDTAGHGGSLPIDGEVR